MSAVLIHFARSKGTVIADALVEHDWRSEGQHCSLLCLHFFSHHQHSARIEFPQQVFKSQYE